jgi:hypothetical protein
MVQVIRTEDPRNKIGEMLGMSLGQGLGQGLSTYFANRSLESVLQDKALEGKPLSEKMQALQSALMPYGEKGAELFQNRMQIEQQAHQEKEQARERSREKIKGKALGKYLKGEQLHPEEEELFTPQEFVAMHKARNPKPTGGITGQPIPQEQINAIEKVINLSPNATPDELAIEMGKAGVSPVYSTPYIENRRRDIENQTNLFNKGYQNNETYLNDLLDGLQASNQMDMRLDQMLSLEDLPTPALAATMEALGIPPSLFSADAETAEKLSIDLTKNIQQFYGNRILQSEFQAFLRSIPTLKNSPEGRKRIAANMKRFNDLKRLEYNTARALELDYEQNKKPLPPSFKRIVYDKMKPEAEKLSNEFSEANKRPIGSAKPQTVPSGKIKVRDPSGRSGTMSLDSFNKAVANGERYERIE